MASLPPHARLLSAFPEGGALAARADRRGHALLRLGPQSVRVLVVATVAKGPTKTGKAAKGAKPKASTSKTRSKPSTKKKTAAPA